MIPSCVNCGKPLPLRGGHECVVNKPVNTANETVNAVVNRKKRGAYPNTHERRTYMREYMRKKRAGK